MLRAASLTLLLIVLLCGASIGYYNAQRITFNYLIGSVQLPLIVLILGELVLVTLIGLVLFAGRVWSLRLEIRGLRKRLAAAEVELKNLRSLAGTTSS